MSNELKKIIEKFAGSGWDVIDAPSKAWLANSTAANKNKLIKAVTKADKSCGTCGCEFDPLYKKALELLRA